MPYRFLLALLLAFTTAAHAAESGKAVFQTAGDKERLVVEYRNDRMRIETQPAQHGHLISRDGRLYAVVAVAERQMSMDALQMIQMARRTGVSIGGLRLDASRLSGDIGTFVRLDDTKRRETVAGIAGQVFRLSYKDTKGQARTAELVLSRDPQLADLTQRLLSIAARLHDQWSGGSDAGLARLAQELQQKRLGLLRLDDKLRLATMDKAAVPEDRFALPAAISIQKRQ